MVSAASKKTPLMLIAECRLEPGRFKVLHSEVPMLVNVANAS